MRKVIMAILEKDLDKIKNKKVLEIGCGDWPFAKDVLEKNGCEWYGLDVIPSDIANVRGTIDKIPFPDKTFDLVLCNQVLEHVYEYGIPWDLAIPEINRVLKINGIFMANSPIHYHGHPWFLFGRLKKIKKCISRYFKDVKLRKFHNEKEKCWRQLSTKGFWSNIGFPDFLFPKNAYSHQLFISAEKCKEIDFESNYVYLFRIPKVLIRFVWAVIKDATGL